MPIIFLPGIQGSKLIDTYPLDFRMRWSLEDMVIGNVFEDSLDFLLKDGRYDAAPEHLFREWELMRAAYGAMVERLRAWVDRALYVFPYDWRQPLEVAARRLNELIDHVRGKLAGPDGPPRVSFVTHSAGGLVLRSALGLRRPDPWADVERIVFIGPPFRGAGDVPRVLIAGERNGWFSDREEYRKLARTFPSVYQLVPDFPGAAVDERGRDLDLFEATSWQRNVVAGEGGFSSRFLADAEAFRHGRRARHGGASEAPMLPDAAMRQVADRVLVLCGSGEPTVIRVPVQTANQRNPNWFELDREEMTLLGDGRVPLVSSAVPGVTLAAYEGVGAHSRLCLHERIIDSTAMWLQGRRLVRMRPRRAIHSVERPSRSYFETWNGDPAALDRHIVAD
ncbi:MAG: lipase/acyltransferase domain-containing protein [Thermoanaerobaculia bacterium]